MEDSYRAAANGSMMVRHHPLDRKGQDVFILGIILLILGAVLDISILYTIGIILVLVGAVLWILGATGRAVGGRAHYF